MGWLILNIKKHDPEIIYKKIKPDFIQISQTFHLKRHIKDPQSYLYFLVFSYLKSIRSEAEKDIDDDDLMYISKSSHITFDEILDMDYIDNSSIVHHQSSNSDMIWINHKDEIKVLYDILNKTDVSFNCFYKIIKNKNKISSI